MFENALLAAALRQMLILGLFVGVGFVAAKGKILPQNAHQTLSKLETVWDTFNVYDKNTASSARKHSDE